MIFNGLTKVEDVGATIKQTKVNIEIYFFMIFSFLKLVIFGFRVFQTAGQPIFCFLLHSLWEGQAISTTLSPQAL